MHAVTSIEAAADLARVRALTRTGAARKLRLGAELSLGEVGSAVGAAKSTIYRWEVGERSPRGEAAVRYAALLDQLLGGRRGIR